MQVQAQVQVQVHERVEVWGVGRLPEEAGLGFE